MRTPSQHALAAQEAEREKFTLHDRHPFFVEGAMVEDTALVPPSAHVSFPSQPIPPSQLLKSALTAQIALLGMDDIVSSPSPKMNKTASDDSVYLDAIDDVIERAAKRPNSPSQHKEETPLIWGT